MALYLILEEVSANEQGEMVTIPGPIFGPYKEINSENQDTRLTGIVSKEEINEFYISKGCIDYKDKKYAHRREVAESDLDERVPDWRSRLTTFER